MGHKNKLKVSKKSINDKIYNIIYKMVKINNCPMLINDIENNIDFNLKLNKKKPLYHINKEHGNILNFIKKDDNFKLIHINSNLYIDINEEWVNVDNPADDIL